MMSFHSYHPKSLLNEYCQKKFNATPEYVRQNKYDNDTKQKYWQSKIIINGDEYLTHKKNLWYPTIKSADKHIADEIYERIVNSHEVEEKIDQDEQYLKIKEMIKEYEDENELEHAIKETQNLFEQNDTSNTINSLYENEKYSLQKNNLEFMEEFMGDFINKPICTIYIFESFKKNKCLEIVHVPFNVNYIQFMVDLHNKYQISYFEMKPYYN